MNNSLDKHINYIKSNIGISSGGKPIAKKGSKKDDKKKAKK